MSIVEFLRARLDEDEAAARAADVKQGDPEWYATHHIAGHTARSRRDNRPIARVEDLAGDDDEDVTGILDGQAASEHIARHDPARVLREVEAKRRILEQHDAWPVLVEGPPELEQHSDHSDLQGITFRMSQQMAWLTTREYVARFGFEAPTTPILRALASVYADHPDYDKAWDTPV